MNINSYIWLGIVGASLLFVVVTYNKLVRLRHQWKTAFAQIDVQLKRRYDLIPNLVETAKSYMQHERETLEAVVQARNQAQQAEQKVASDPTDAQAMKGLNQAESQLGGALGRLMAVFESYPDLKANQNMSQLMEELSSTENRISFARQHYNDSVMQYNVSRESFPNILIVGFLGFQPAQPFEVELSEERQNIKVSFSS